MTFTYKSEQGRTLLKPGWALSLGLVASLFSPILFYLFYAMNYIQGDLNPIDVLVAMSHSSLLTKTIFFCLTPNYFFLYVCAKKEWMYTLYGVFIPTILCCIVALVFL